MKHFALFLILLVLAFPVSGDDKFVVVIDPGHGGNNIGAVSGELVEKDLTLDLAKRVGELFRKRPYKNLRLLYTRQQDVSFPIKKRVDFILETEPDLVVSLHFNSQKVLTTNRGFEIYYPADFLGTDAKNVAFYYDRANRSFLYAGIFQDVYAKRNIEKVWKLPFNMVSQRENLMIFDDTRSPSLLLEIAYLTSPEDRACIENPEFLDDIAAYIHDAIAAVLIYNKNLKAKSNVP